MGSQARAVIERINANAGARRRRRRANADILEWLTPHSLNDVRNELEQLRASYEVVHLSGKGRPEWDIHYGEWMRFYDQTKKQLDETWIGWGIGQALIDQIRDRRRQLEAWRGKLASEGVKVAEPPKAEPPKGALGQAKDAAGLIAVAVGLYLVAKAVS